MIVNHTVPKIVQTVQVHAMARVTAFCSWTRCLTSSHSDSLNPGLDVCNV